MKLLRFIHEIKNKRGQFLTFQLLRHSKSCLQSDIIICLHSSKCIKEHPSVSEMIVHFSL